MMTNARSDKKSSNEIINQTIVVGDKFNTLSDLVIYRDLILDYDKELDERVKKLKSRLLRNLSLVILLSVMISYVIMWQTRSDLVRLTVVLLDLFFMIAFAAYLPRLTKIEHYKSYDNITSDRNKIKQLREISDLILICCKTILDNKNTKKIKVSYTINKGKYGELLKRIRNFQQNDATGISDLLKRNSIPIRLEIINHEYEKHELFRYIMSGVIQSVIIDNPVSKEFQILKSEIENRNIIEYDKKHLHEIPEWINERAN